MTSNQRLKEVQKILNFRTQQEFADALGIKQGSLSDIYRGKVGVSSAILLTLSKDYSINIEWLKTGEGSMLNPSEGAKADIAGTIVATDEESYSEALQAGLALTPEYSTVFHGGQGISSEGQSTVAHWHIPNAPKDAVIIPMLGNSMSPRFSSGSRLVVRPIEFFTPTSITFGDVFAVVVQDEYGYDPATHIKILRRHKDSAKERTHWIARSVNRDEYDDFDIDISRVSKLYKVIGSVDLFEIM